MARIKVITTHYTDAPNRYIAEERVEQGLVPPDAITSEPATDDPRDIIAFGLAQKIYADHNKIFFNNLTTDEYLEEIGDLSRRTLLYVRHILDDIIVSNEQDWQ